ncbi:hypothetical protein CRUP_031153 [Coryphaenoides rupestris]|nr:hypothetical protein CRUP_031153 [Coryphaenoides rupestris]
MALSISLFSWSASRSRAVTRARNSSKLARRCGSSRLSWAHRLRTSLGLEEHRRGAQQRNTIQLGKPRLTAEVPLNPEELENVFDTLDKDGNGYLTLDEFSSGFSEFLCSQQESSVPEETMPCQGRSEVTYQNQWEHKLAAGGDDDDDDEKHFLMLMESLGASHVFEE